MSQPYRIIIEMGDNGWWTVDIPDVPGAHTEGQTLAAARRNAKEVIAMMLDLPDGAEDGIVLDERLILPEHTERAVTDLSELRRHMAGLTAALQEATGKAFLAIDKEFDGLGLRDQAELLGVSFQRVQQLRPGAPRRGRRAAPTSA